MKQSIIIGRQGDQPFTIAPDLERVHRQHARLTLDSDSRDWFIEDLKGQGGNGVYLRDNNGNFRRIFSCHIKPTDIIRLGPENAKSFTFMAHHVLSPDDYNYEFAFMKALDAKLRKAEEEHAAVVRKHNLNALIVPAVCLLIVMVIRLVFMKDLDFGLLFIISAAVTAIPPMCLKLYYRNDAERTKQLKLLRSKLIKCPKCWRNLSEYDIANSRCSVCKAM